MKLTFITVVCIAEENNKYLCFFWFIELSEPIEVYLYKREVIALLNFLIEDAKKEQDQKRETKLLTEKDKLEKP